MEQNDGAGMHCFTLQCSLSDVILVRNLTNESLKKIYTNNPMIKHLNRQPQLI